MKGDGAGGAVCDRALFVASTGKTCGHRPHLQITEPPVGLTGCCTACYCDAQETAVLQVHVWRKKVCLGFQMGGGCEPHWYMPVGRLSCLCVSGRYGSGASDDCSN